jgi:hypothetical protein
MLPSSFYERVERAEPDLSRGTLGTFIDTLIGAGADV